MVCSIVLIILHATMRMYLHVCMYEAFSLVTYITMSVCLSVCVCVVCAAWLVSLGIVVGMDVAWQDSGCPGQD